MDTHVKLKYYILTLMDHLHVFMPSRDVVVMNPAYIYLAILCLTSRMTVMSARIPNEDACYRARNLCVISRIQKGTPGLTHKGCALYCVSYKTLSDVTVVLG